MAEAKKKGNTKKSNKSNTSNTSNTVFSFLVKTPSTKVQKFSMNVNGEKKHFNKGDTVKVDIINLDWLQGLCKDDAWISNVVRMLQYGINNSLPLVLGPGYGGQISCNAHNNMAFKNVVGIQDGVIFVTRNNIFDIKEVPLVHCRPSTITTWKAYNPTASNMNKLLDWLDEKA